MYDLNKLLIVLLAALLLVACVGSIGASDLKVSALGDDSGSGSVGDDDGSAAEGSSYDDNTNVGSAYSEDDDLEEPLDEEYYSSASSSNGNTFTVSLEKHATGNTLLFLVLSLISVGGIWFKY